MEEHTHPDLLDEAIAGYANAVNIPLNCPNCLSTQLQAAPVGSLLTWFCDYCGIAE